MRIAITGATGLIGAALSDSLQNSGHHVTRLSRRPSSEPDFSVWDPDTGVAEGIEDAEAIVHLAGENIAGGRWTPGRKQRILDSRVSGTKRLCESLAALPSPPPTLITASAVGFYGDRGSAIIDESSPAGQGFLPEVCQAWEAAALGGGPCRSVGGGPCKSAAAGGGPCSSSPASSAAMRAM